LQGLTKEKRGNHKGTKGTKAAITGQRGPSMRPFVLFVPLWFSFYIAGSLFGGGAYPLLERFFQKAFAVDHLAADVAFPGDSERQTN
jgi:hypothetical protein